MAMRSFGKLDFCSFRKVPEPSCDEETVVHDEHDEQIEAAEISTHNIVQSSSAAAHNEQILVPSLGVGEE
ncbi:hypothetical protein V6N13_009185 [Hibiscus sabdariffa]